MKKYQNSLHIVIGSVTCILIILAYCALTGQPFSKTWLPDPGAKLNRGFALANLPVKVESIRTDFGSAKKYTTSNSMQVIYEFHYNPFLRTSTCPNISNIKPVESTWCMPIGISHGAVVYAINRRLPSGVTEYYTKRGNTFIYIKSGGEGFQRLDYLNTFVNVSGNDVNTYLTNNRDALTD